MCHSSCNDVICADGGNCVISAHFDKKIRVWDTRYFSVLSRTNVTDVILHELFSAVMFFVNISLVSALFFG